MSYIIDNCQLEVDKDRGVIYVHHPEGYTVLRMEGLPAGAAIKDHTSMLDINLKHQDLKPYTFNWGSDFKSKTRSRIQEALAKAGRKTT